MEGHVNEKPDVGLAPKRIVALVDGLLHYGMTKDRIVHIFVDQFGMKPLRTDVFWDFYRIEKMKTTHENGYDSAGSTPKAMSTILARIMRREKSSGRLGKLSHPDYSRIKQYKASAEELSSAGLLSVDDLVRRINAHVGTKRKFPVSQFDYPNSKKKFVRLVSQLLILDS